MFSYILGKKSSKSSSQWYDPQKFGLQVDEIEVTSPGERSGLVIHDDYITHINDVALHQLDYLSTNKLIEVSFFLFISNSNSYSIFTEKMIFLRRTPHQP